MRLVSNGSQMLTSKCGKNKVVNEAQLSALLADSVTTFRRLLSSIAGQIHTNMDTICFRVFEKETKCC